MKENENEKRYLQVVCPKCGYRMPIFYSLETQTNDLFVQCKGRNCDNYFEVKIKDGKQIK